MSIWEIILIGVALAMDAFALTIANCTSYKNSLTRKKAWAMPAAFAIFQFLMPVIGFYVGSIFSNQIEQISKFITAGIFFVLAVKIVADNVKELKKSKKENPTENTAAAFTLGVLLMQAVATSIDALMVGVTFAVSLTFSVFLASLVIGAVTFIIVAVALLIGKSLGKVLGKYAQWAGAIILLALSVKNLVEGIIG